MDSNPRLSEKLKPQLFKDHNTVILYISTAPICTKLQYIYQVKHPGIYAVTGDNLKCQNKNLFLKSECVRVGGFGLFGTRKDKRPSQMGGH